LTSQMRKAGVSVPANIAEGFKKKTRPDKARYLNIAQGSLEECRYYLILAQDLGYGDTSNLMLQLEETSKLLEAYLSGLQNSESRSQESGEKNGEERIQEPGVRSQNRKQRIQEPGAGRKTIG